MTVYLVESGIYSDREIDGVFSTYEMAEKYIAHCKHNDGDRDYSYHIYEYNVDEYIFDDREIWYRYELEILKNKNGLEISDMDIIPIYKSDVKNDEIEVYNGMYITFITYHKDKNLDIKVVADRYYKKKAEEMFG